MDLWEGLLTGVWEVRREVRIERWRSNQASRESRVGSCGGAGKTKSPKRGVSESQSVRAQFGEGIGGERTG